MSKKGLKKGFLLFIGILSVVVIVLTQSFYKPVSDEKAKAKTEQSDSKDQATIHAPSDVVANGNTLAVNESEAIVPQQSAISEETKKVIAVVRQGLFRFFRTLFRTSIAPNAP
jgi:cell division protein FtsI/penicillin-binding protein 2